MTHLSVQALLLRLQLTEGALELFQLTLKTRNFPLGQELLLLLHTFNITLAKTEGGRPPVMVNPHSLRRFLVLVDSERKQNSKVTTITFL